MRRDRSQMMNKAKAMVRLKAKLAIVLEQQRLQDVKEIRGDGQSKFHSN